MPKKPISKEENQFKEQIIEDIRPWGKFRSYPYKYARNIKIITVNPGAILSLQYHNLRSEFWIALDNGFKITIGEVVRELKKNEEVFIPKKMPHRLKCIGKEPARIMELWLGDSDESDIVRLQDDYGRVKASSPKQ